MDATVSPLPRAALTHGEIRTIIFGVMLSMLLAALDQTIVATALPTIGSDLGDLQNISWVVTAYLLASTAVTPLYGKLADIKGRRTVMMAAIVIFIVGSIACALAPTMLFLVLARALQGLGGGGLISLAQTIIGDAVPPKERSRYMAYFGGIFALSSVAGPILGGFLTQLAGWSSIFWINVPLGGLALITTFHALKRLPRHERQHTLDYAGAGLLVVAAVTLLLALTWGGQTYPWTSARILGLIAASAIAWLLFGIRLATAAEPFLPLGVLRNPVIAYATLAGFFAVGTMVGLSIYLPVLFQSSFGMKPSTAGLSLIPFSVAVVAGAQASGRGMAKLVHYKRVPVVGLILAIAASLLVTVFIEQLGIAGLEGMLMLIGLGVGTLFPISLVMVQNAVEPHHMGTATGTMNFMRALGSSILVTVFGAIFLAGLGSLAAGGSVESIVSSAKASGISLSGAFRGVFLASTICFVIAFVFLLLLEEQPLRGRGPAPAMME